MEDLTKHKTDSEQIFVGEEACQIVNKSKKEGHKVCAIGASVLKATETAAGPGSRRASRGGQARVHQSDDRSVLEVG